MIQPLQPNRLHHDDEQAACELHDIAQCFQQALPQDCQEPIQAPHTNNSIQRYPYDSPFGDPIIDKLWDEVKRAFGRAAKARKERN